MTSSLTTATMWSSGTTAACAGPQLNASSSGADAAISSASTQCGLRHSGRLRNFIARPVSGNTYFQNVERVGADAPHSDEFELQEHRIGGLVLLGGQVLDHSAHRPAAGIVLKPRQALDQLVVLERIVVAVHAVPAAGQRPLAGQVDLLGGLVNETVAKVQRAAGGGPIRRAEVLADEGAVLGVELQRRIGTPGRRDLPADRGEQVGGVAGARLHAGQRDQLVGEVIALAEGELQALESAGRLGEAAGDRERQLVGIVDAVAADELVLGEHLRVAEVQQRGVEYRNQVLVAEGRVDVVGAGLQRLFVVAPGEAERTVEGDAGIEAEDRQAARDVRLGRAVVERVVGAVP